MQGVKFTHRETFGVKVAHSGEQMVTGDLAISRLATKPGTPVGLYSLQLLNVETLEIAEVMVDANTLAQLGAWIAKQAGDAK